MRLAKVKGNKKNVVAKIPEEGSEETGPRSEAVMDAGEVDGTAGTCTASWTSVSAVYWNDVIPPVLNQCYILTVLDRYYIRTAVLDQYYILKVLDQYYILTVLDQYCILTVLDQYYILAVLDQYSTGPVLYTDSTGLVPTPSLTWSYFPDV